MNQAQRIGNEIYREAMAVSVCSICGKILMYWVTIKGKKYCEQCAPLAWDMVEAMEHSDQEAERRAAQRGVL